MICAAEYMNIKSIAEKEEEIRKLKFQEEKKEFLSIIHCRTKEFCENELNQMLIKNAENNKLHTTIWVSKVIDHYYNIESCGFVYEETTTYVNGDKSFAINNVDTIGLNFLTKYLNEHCYKVSTKPHNFKSYGCGELKGFDIIIEPNLD